MSLPPGTDSSAAALRWGASCSSRPASSTPASAATATTSRSAPPRERTVVVTLRPGSRQADLHRRSGDLLRAGEGNIVLAPILGPRSVLLLDGAEHLRHRRLMLPPFHGERMRALRRAMAEVAERHVARWPRRPPFAVQPRDAGDHARGDHARGVRGRGRARREPLRGPAAAPARHDRQPRRVLILGLTAPERRRAAQPLGRFARARERRRRADLRGDRGAPRGPDREPSATTCCSMLLAARDEDGRPLTDAELRDELMTLLRRRPRDHGHRARLDARAPDPPPGGARAAARRGARRRRRRLPRRRDQGDAAPAAGRPGGGRAGCRSRWSSAAAMLPAGVHIAPSIYLLHRRPDLYPDPLRSGPSASSAPTARHLRVDPVRRRRAPLPRRELRAVRDEDRARHDPPRAPLRPARRRRARSR